MTEKLTQAEIKKQVAIDRNRFKEQKENILKDIHSGLSYQDISNKYEITYHKLTRFIGEDPDCAKAKTLFKENKIKEAEKSLVKICNGFYIENTKETNREGKITTEKYRQFVPPNVTALIFFLKKNHPDIYSDSKTLQLTEAQLKVLTDEELSFLTDVLKKIESVNDLAPKEEKSKGGRPVKNKSKAKVVAMAGRN